MYNVVIGLDISKVTIDACSLQANDTKPTSDAFLNKQLGFKQLIKWATKTNPLGLQTIFCLEQTGYYSRKICDFFKQNNIHFALVNPVKIKRSMGVIRGKSDKADAMVIARFGLKFPEELRPNVNLSQEFLELQLLLAHRKRIQKKEIAFSNQQKHLKHCITGIFARKIIKNIELQRRFLTKQQKMTEKMIKEFVQQNQLIKNSFDLLISIPGIGTITALHTILHTQNFTQVNTPRKFSCYCGVAPFKNESGTSIQKKSKVSYFGNKKLKSCLSFAAMSAVQNDPQIKAYYQRKVKQGKSKMSVLNAVRNKLIHRMFAVIKRQAPYVVQQVF